MNYYTAMMQSFEREKNKQAGLITGGIALAMLLAFIFLKWPLPKIELTPPEMYVEVQLEQPKDVKYGGGGGGGNTVKAPNPKGIAKPSVVPGVKEESKDFETNDKDEKAPEATKPANPKPTAKAVVPNTSPIKTNPKPIVETPAPPTPKAVAGKTLTGSGTGGGTADKYDVAGVNGNGHGVGKVP